MSRIGRFSAKSGRHWVLMGGAVAVCAASLVGCGSSSSKSGAKTTSSTGIRSEAGTSITLEGPNQWTQSGSSFGAPWLKEMAAFKAKTGITVKTDVLPLASFNQTESTQLAAGTAPDLVFNQAAFKPYMVVDLTPYLNKPNPFVAGNKKWLSVFNSKYFGPKIASVLDTSGHMDYVPFNLVGVGIFYNKTAFAKAHVTAPITTYSKLITACKALKSAGYTPLAGDASNIGVAWTAQSLFNMLSWSQQPSWNHFNAAGKPGTNPSLTTEDYSWAVATGKLKASDPQEVAWLTLMKQVFDSCVTTNWSGVTGLSGDGVGLPQFESGKAAMAWGVDFGYSTIKGASTFPISSMPFPTVTKASSPASVNAPAQFGLSVGGTSYMIPAHTSGKALKASMLLLQFMTSGQNIKGWLASTGGVPAVVGLTPPGATAGFLEGSWGETARDGGGPPGIPLNGDVAPGVTILEAYEGYLLGNKSLSQEESYLENLWKQSAAYNVNSGGWGSQSWTKGLPSSA
jgi:ABC-type glycerol-3-phosphate transport system substrate-binding protein